MRLAVTVLIHLLLVPMVVAQAGKRSESGRGNVAPARPKSVDEAVQLVKANWLAPDDRDWILRNPKNDIVTLLYPTLGMAIRNELGLWGDNQPLRDSCGTNDPEACSDVILNRLWESVRADADPALLVQLECQFLLAGAVQIDQKGFHKRTVGRILKALQTQIEKEMAPLVTVGTPMCQSVLKLEVQGKPDKNCYMSVPAAETRSRLPVESTLDRVLFRLSIDNGFIVLHRPPAIVLQFFRQCQFPTPPYLHRPRKKDVIPRSWQKY